MKESLIVRQLLIRADDIGYSYAVNLGIARSIQEGLVRSVGIMPNMPEAKRGTRWIQKAASNSDIHLALGQHTNICLGKPCAEPEKIPSLLQKDGEFKKSITYRDAYKQGEDFVVYDEAIIEIEAQYKRFKQIVGSKPDYFEAHAIASNTLFHAIHDVAQEHNLREQPISFNPEEQITCGKTPVRLIMHSMDQNYNPIKIIQETIIHMSDNETVVMVFHPGYLDDFVLTHSSLTFNRTKEVDALIDPKLKEWINKQPNLKLITYCDL